MNIPFARPDITQEEREAVDRVLASGWLTSGPEVEAFEREFAKSVGASEAIALNSCTAALHLSLLAAGLGPEDAVLLPAVTFIATAEAVLYTGALPLLSDVDSSTLLLTPELVMDFLERECEFWDGTTIHKRTQKRLRAVLPVHLGGRPCDLPALQKICADFGLLLIDDSAHAFGSRINKAPIGSDELPQSMSAFSFYATKNITTGEGGMLTLRDHELARRIRYKRLHGIRGQSYGRARWDYDVVLQGYKYNLTDMAAAIGRVQLSRSDAMQARRKKIHDFYNKEFLVLKGLRPPPSLPASHESSYHLYIVQLRSKEERDAFVDYMFEHGVGVSLHFIPLYRHSLWKERFGTSPNKFPGSEAAFAHMVSLPIYSALSDAEIEYVASTIRGFWA